MVHRRPIHWVGSTLADLRAFPAAARRRVGQELDLLHAFQKKTRQTARMDLELGEKRHRELLRQRATR